MYIAVMNGYRERRAVIEQLGKELLEVNEQGLEQVEGHRVVELLATTPIASMDDSSSPDSNGSAPHSAPSVRLYQSFSGLFSGMLCSWPEVAWCHQQGTSNCSHVLRSYCFSGMIIM